MSLIIPDPTRVNNRVSDHGRSRDSRLTTADHAIHVRSRLITRFMSDHGQSRLACTNRRHAPGEALPPPGRFAHGFIRVGSSEACVGNGQSESGDHPDSPGKCAPQPGAGFKLSPRLPSLPSRPRPAASSRARRTELEAGGEDERRRSIGGQGAEPWRLRRPVPPAGTFRRPEEVPPAGAAD